MTRMKRLLCAAAVPLFLFPAQAWATWSIVAIDQESGLTAISSATCVVLKPDQLPQLQAIVVPGVGVAAAQASVDGTHANQNLIFEELQRYTNPEQIITMLSADPNFDRRQFGIVNRLGGFAGHSGTGTTAASIDLQGESPDGIVYSVQGNIITTEAALEEAARIMQEDTSPMLDRIMLAMEAVDAGGGDSRCIGDRHSQVAYIIGAEANDPMGNYAPDYPGGPTRATQDLRAPFNTGDYHLYIAVGAANMLETEDPNPVVVLRERYDAWKVLVDGAAAAEEAAGAEMTARREAAEAAATPAPTPAP